MLEAERSNPALKLAAPEAHGASMRRPLGRRSLAPNR